MIIMKIDKILECKVAIDFVEKRIAELNELIDKYPCQNREVRTIQIKERELYAKQLLILNTHLKLNGYDNSKTISPQ